MSRLLIFALFLISYTAGGQNRFVTANSWGDVLSKAGQSNKLIIIDCYFEGCHPCKLMDDEAFPHPTVSQLMKDQFVGIKVDCLKEELGKELQVKFGVTGFPTYLIFTSDGMLVDYFSGYKEAGKFLNLLNGSIRLAKTHKILAGFSPSLSVDYPAFYTDFFKERKSYSKEQVDSYFWQQEDRFKEAAVLPVIMSRNLSDSLADFFLNNYNQLVTRFGSGLINAQRMRIVQRMIAKAPAGGGNQWLASFLKKMKGYSNDSDWDYFRLDIAEAYYFDHLKDPASFFRFAKENFNDDDNKIRYMGMRLGRAGTTDEQRGLYIKWAAKVLDESSNQEALFILASVLLKHGDKVGATKYATWAVNKAKLNNQGTDAAQRLLDKIKAGY